MTDDLTGWKQDGLTGITLKQRKMLNAVAGDLSNQVKWHGRKLSKDSYRHLLSGIAAGWLVVPGYDDGTGVQSVVMLGASSMSLTKTQACEAITIGLHIGDHPEEQNLPCKPVRWCDKVLLGRGENPNDYREEALA